MTNEVIEVGEDIVVDQSSLIQQYLGRTKGNLVIINDNRHINVATKPKAPPEPKRIEAPVNANSWQELLEIVLEKVPEPRLKNINEEITRIADRKCATKVEAGEYIGVKYSTFKMKVIKANKPDDAGNFI